MYAAKNSGRNRVVVDQHGNSDVWAADQGVTIGELVDFLADEVVARHMLKVDREFYPLFKTAPSG